MSGAIYTAAAGAMAQQVRLELTANNLANVNANAYKAVASIIRTPEAALEQGVRIGENQRNAVMLPHQSLIDFSPGPLKPTGNPFDLALNGDGFFCVSTSEGVRFTRNGHFMLNIRGEVVTADGHFVMGSRGKIVTDGDNIRVKVDGTITSDDADIDRLQIVDFPKPYALKSIGDAMYVPLDSKTLQFEPEGIEVLQGSLETSNVAVIREMTQMIEANRLFESYHAVIKAVDESTGRLISRIGDVTA